jgi:hypothetical protein
MSGHVEKYAKPANVEEYVRSAVQGFLGDPPDTDSQWGYLSALLAVAKEALGQRIDTAPFAEAHELQKTYELVGTWDQEGATLRQDSKGGEDEQSEEARL